MEHIKEFFKKDLFASHCGIELVDVSKGTAVAKMKITKEHLNGVGTVQGGAIFTLADLAFAAASNSHGNVAVAINAGISFLKAVNKGTLTATAREISINPKIATYTINVTDDDGDIISVFQGMVYRKNIKLDEI